LVSSLDHVGPMTRSAADLPLALAILDGTYRPGGTAFAPDPALLRGLRVLIVEDLHADSPGTEKPGDGSASTGFL
jgi:Asp-tRNA(Asn)/Glu-tRNA(Gln) amidotransferase A subunit family amidase